MNMKKSVGEYRTKDLSEATTLVVKGIKLLNIAKEENKCWFVFEESLQRNEISNCYWFGKCLVDARNYYQTNMMLKSRIFS